VKELMGHMYASAGICFYTTKGMVTTASMNSINVLDNILF
jgi:hypothetical protein